MCQNLANFIGCFKVSNFARLTMHFACDVGRRKRNFCHFAATDKLHLDPLKLNFTFQNYFANSKVIMTLAHFKFEFRQIL